MNISLCPTFSKSLSRLTGQEQALVKTTVMDFMMAPEASGHGVDRLPRDRHGHDRRLAAARRHLHGHAEELGIGLIVGAFDVLQEPCRRRRHKPLALGEVRHSSTNCRFSLMIGVGLYSTSAEDRPAPVSKTIEV
ncbi:hypothetical protein LG334_22350 [Caenispirillum salinarum]